MTRKYKRKLIFYNLIIIFLYTYLGEGGLIIFSKSSGPSTKPREVGQLSLDDDRSFPLCKTLAL